jgi:ectoine hydroxylase-related dioxygenase (phytanoyl-CoA dioxygenase family)
MTHHAAIDAQSAADQIRTNGYVILEDLLPLSLITAMRDAFDPLLEQKRQAEQSNRGANRFQMYLPFVAPFADPLVYENDAVLAILEKTLGPDILCTYFASDTPLPGAEYQRVHSDTRLLFPETQLSLPCYGTVLNIPLVDVTEENGPMEIWPGGTHLWAGGVDMEAMAERMTSRRVTMKAGSALLRDLRMWHRGTPHHGTRSRPNVALVYTRPWYRFEQKVPVMTRAAYDSLSERSQRMFRFSEIIG